MLSTLQQVAQGPDRPIDLHSSHGRRHARPVRVLRVVDAIDWADRAGLHGRVWLDSVRAMDAAACATAPVVLRAPEAVMARAARQGLGVRSLNRLPVDPRIVADLVRLIGEFRADVLHLDGPWSTAFGRLAAALSRRPVLLERSRGRDELYFATWQPVATRPQAQPDRAEDTVVVPEDRLQAWTRLQPADGAAGCRLELNIPLGARVIGAFTDGARAADLSALLDAAYLLPSQYDSHLIFIGDAAVCRALRRRVDELAMGHHTHCLSADRLEAVLSLIDVAVVPRGVAPSRLVRTMLAGRPAIVLDEAAHWPIVVHGRTGWQLADPTPKTLARALDHLLMDSGLAVCLGTAAREQARRHGLTRYVARLQEWYDALAGSLR